MLVSQTVILGWNGCRATISCDAVILKRKHVALPHVGLQAKRHSETTGAKQGAKRMHNLKHKPKSRCHVVRDNLKPPSTLAGERDDRRREQPRTSGDDAPRGGRHLSGISGSRSHPLLREIYGASRNRLKRMALPELFEFSKNSAKNYKRVSSFLQDQPNVDIDVPLGYRSGAFRFMPVELIDMIVNLLSLRDRIMFAASCRIHRAIVMRSILTSAASCIKPYNLSLIDLRFLQCCTSATLAGPVIRRLFYEGPDMRWPRLRDGREPSTVSTPLDIYSARYESLPIAAFLTYATGYEIGGYTGAIPAREAVQHAICLRKKNAPDINVFESRSDNPLDAILHLPSTADMGSLKLDRLWHPYPAATFEGVALTSPYRLPVDFAAERRTAWEVLQSSMRAGFWVDSHWTRSHQCSRNASCPISWRSSNDSGCLKLLLPTLPYAAQGTDYIWNYVPEASWTLGGASFCPKARPLGETPAPRSYKDMDYQIWVDGIFALMKRASRP
ncbi:hypothetical protein C8R43DRAFT_949966 [Mycena crocata]|nr:hypothetical protein C8R43DRAFT_949966 [Mycena crocata]